MADGDAGSILGLTPQSSTPGTAAGQPAPTAATGQNLTPAEKTQLSESQNLLGLGTAVSNVAQAAPQLDPSTAVTVAQTGGNLDQKSQSVAHAKNQTDTAAAAQHTDSSHGGGLLDALDWVGHRIADSPVTKDVLTTVGDVSKALNKPLNIVQHEYRYLHDVEARHGMTAALTEGLLIAGAGVAGTVAGGGNLGVGLLAAEGATATLGQITYHDSWERTTDGNKYRDPNTGNVVSFGRDVTSVLDPSLETKANDKSEDYGTLAGVLDGLGDILTDPVGLGGKVVAEARSVEGAPGLLKKVWGGTSINPDNVDEAYGSYRSVRNAVHAIANTDDAGTIAAHFPLLTPVAKDLAKAKTDEEVLTVFKSIAKTRELVTDQMPSQTFVGSSLQRLKDAASNYDGPVAENFLFGPARWSRRMSKVPGFAIDSSTLKQLGNELDPTNDYSGIDLYRMVRYSQGDLTAKYALNQWLSASPAERIILAKNTYMDVIAHMAHFERVDPDDLKAGYLGKIKSGNLTSRVLHPAGSYEILTHQEVRSALKERMDEFFNREHPGVGGVYGMYKTGEKTPDVFDPETGRNFSAAVTEKQVGNIAVPSFTQVKRMAAGLQGAYDISGKLDDFVYNTITAPFFKRFVLLSASYANHIALAEAVPNSLRLGLKNMVKARYYATSAKLGYKTDARDVDGLIGYLLRHEDVPQALINKPDIWKEAATILALKSEGHMVTEAMSSGESFTKELSGTEKARGSFRNALRSTPRYQKGNDFGIKELSTMTGPEKKMNNQGYLEYWRNWHREVTRSPAHKAAAWAYARAAKAGKSEDEGLADAAQAATKNLQKMGKKELKRYQRSKLFSMRNPPAGMTPLDDWGQQIAANMRASLGSEPNGMMLSHIMNGTTPTLASMGQIPETEWPIAVKGRQLIPDTSSPMSRLADRGFNKIISPYVNFLSRQPLAMNEMVREWKALRPLVTSGQLGYDEAANLAMTRMSYRSLRFVHNLHDRSQISETLRNWVPFYFAQEQAYKRMGRLLAEDPGAFRRYQLMIAGVGTMAAKQQDGQGNDYYSFPGGTWLAKGTTDMARLMGMNLNNVDVGGFATTLSSANVIFPLSTGYRPDLSPVAVAPVKVMDAIFPELGPSLSKLVGSPAMTSSWWSLAVPNTTAQRAIRTIAGSITGGTGDRAFASTMMQSMQLALYDQNEALKKWYADNQQGPKPQIVPDQTASYKTKQKFVNRIKNQTMILYGMNTVLGFFSPTSTSVDVKNFGFPTELSDDIDKSGSVSQGILKFLNKHPDATPWTVFQSYVPTGDDATGTSMASIPSNDSGEQWIQNNRPFINANPYSAYYMMPKETGKYDSAVYNEQLAQSDRVKRTPDQFLNALYVNATNTGYYANLTKFENYVNDPTTGKGQKDAAYTNWNNYVNSLSAANPTWAQYGPLNKASKTVVMQQSIQEMEKQQASGDFPKNDVSEGMMAVLTSFQTANSAYQAASQERDYSTAEKTVKDAWQNYIISIGKSRPDLKSGLDAIFLEALGEVNSSGNPSSS